MSSNWNEPWTNSEGMSHREIVERIANDPGIRERVEATLAEDPEVQEGRRLYAEAAGPLLAELQQLVPDLEAINHKLEGVGDLYRVQVRHVDEDGNETSRRPLDYRAAVPVLLEWLPKVRYAPLAEDIVSALSAPFAKKQARPLLLRLFRESLPVENPQRPDNTAYFREQLRWRIGETLGKFSDPTVADDMIELARDPSFGHARSQIVNPGLAKTKDPRVPEILLDLLEDPTVAPAAAQGLGRLRHTPAQPHLERALHSTDENLRYQAKKALKRLT
ncbi:hypothetical protein GCM10012275_30450 [Longimycelium tulufanense]|uniref:HEAT repeat domain-containing protein n=1 Tax=Longimycelium tulufanense TaxID=907463 RepID=A0A8J3CC39_9PSEU|nr:HEAT repeat domain-containing protein [Longimycelium tulufanense]GGM57259.1 hypothetical protein GCM10012275_30450 [Longimycelium tulufanense]